MEENNNPRRTRSGKLLGGVIPGEEAEGQEEVVVEMLAVEGIIREETVVDVIDLTEDYFDDDDGGGAGDMGDINEDTGNGTITIFDDEASTDDLPTGDNELNEDRNQGVVPDFTVDLTDSPMIRSNPTVFVPNFSVTFISESTLEASLPSTSGASMPQSPLHGVRPHFLLQVPPQLHQETRPLSHLPKSFEAQRFSSNLSLIQH